MTVTIHVQRGARLSVAAEGVAVLKYNMQCSTSQNAQSSIQVIDRAVSILSVLGAGQKGSLSLSEIARRADLTRSTTRRILVSLERHRFCERLEDGQYQLGLRLFELGQVVQNQLDLRERSRNELEAVAHNSELTAFLCIRDGDRAICIDRIEGKLSHSLALKLGGSLPLHVGAAPKVLLAFAPSNVIDSYLSRGSLATFTEMTVVSEAELRREFETIRLRGWSVSDGDVTENVAAIGAPLFDHSCEVVGAISISGLRPYVVGARQESLVRVLINTAEHISARLGYLGERDSPAVSVDSRPPDVTAKSS